MAQTVQRQKGSNSEGVGPGGTSAGKRGSTLTTVSLYLTVFLLH